jgi:hypothetical protein
MRKYIFVTGHPIGAFKGTIQINEGQYKLDRNVLDGVVTAKRGFYTLTHILPNH